jgi:uncharacterized membrane protein YdcZ (DUF606 family)
VDFALMLMDTGIVFKDFFRQNAHMAKPIFAFFTLYSLIVVIFAALYRLISHLSSTMHFAVNGAPAKLSFVEALYFSFITISTVGYGDILPLTSVIRFLVGAQVFMGMVLFFFGVHAIIAHRRD